jgi:hypothetical protein
MSLTYMLLALVEYKGSWPLKIIQKIVCIKQHLTRGLVPAKTSFYSKTMEIADFRIDL